MIQTYLEPKGQFDVVALIDDSYDYVGSSYKVYKNKQLLFKAENVDNMVKKLVSMHNFDIGELEFALLEMIKNHHDISHFGVFGTFLYTSDSLDSSDFGVA